MASSGPLRTGVVSIAGTPREATMRGEPWILGITLPLLAVAILVPGAAQAKRLHTDTCVELTAEGPPPERRAQRKANLADCPVRHTSDNDYERLQRSHHKYIVLTKDRPIRLEVDGPGVGFRHLFLWKYADGQVVDGGSYTITIVRDGAEFVRKTFPIRVYPKHEVYGSAQRMRTTMPSRRHTYEIRLQSDSPGAVIYYWKVGSIDGLHLHDDWKPATSSPSTSR